MKTIYLFLLGANLFISCNNAKTDKNEITKDAVDNTTGSKDNWPAADRDLFMNDCVRKPGEDKGGTNEQCSCLLEKAESFFSSYTSYDNNKEDNPEWQKNGDAFENAADECRSKFAEQKDNETSNNNSNSQTGWSEDDINKFRDNQCKQISTEYCDCRLQVAKKHAASWKDYQRMALLDNNPNSAFWQDFNDCTKKYK